MINTIDIRLSTSNFFLRSKFERVKVNYGVRLRCARFAHCNFCYRVQLTLPKHSLELESHHDYKRILRSSNFLVPRAKKTFEGLGLEGLEGLSRVFEII